MTRFLLDTHVFLWLQLEPARLGDAAQLLADPDADLLVSAVVSWEIAIKHALGRLPLPEPPSSYMPSRIRAINAQPLAIEHSHALDAGALPALHRDPFDRLLVAQGASVDATLVTADEAVAQYGTATLLVGR